MLVKHRFCNIFYLTLKVMAAYYKKESSKIEL